MTMSARIKRGFTVVLGLVLLTLAGVWGWTHPEAAWVRALDIGPRWYVLPAAWAPSNRTEIPAIAAQLRSGVADPASSPASTPRVTPRAEVVQVKSSFWYRRQVVLVLGSCDASARGHGELEARFLDVTGDGPCAFSGQFDVATRRFDWFQFEDARSPANLGRGCHQVRGGAWRIAPDMVAMMRAQVFTRTQAHKPAYLVQIQGRVDHGRRIVDIRGDCETLGGDEDYLNWGLMEIDDGGDCVFDAEFDPQTRLLTRFDFHGVA